MSRIGKQPVPLAKGVEVKMDGRTVTVKGPKGTLSRTFPNTVSVAQQDGALVVSPADGSRDARAMYGTARALLANMVQGVSDGFTRQLLIEGTGYRAEAVGRNLQLNMGYSHPVLIEAPEGVTFEVSRNNKELSIKGIDKEVIGELAAKIRAVRPPEPYKGKGIRYSTERIRRKAGKSGKK